MDMTITAVSKSHITQPALTTYISSSILTTNDMSENNATKIKTFREQKENGGDGLIAVYVIVPVLILIGLFVMLFFFVKRRHCKNRGENHFSSSESIKANDAINIGVDNEAFSDQYPKEVHNDSHSSTGPSTYENVEVKNSIYYENGQNEYQQSENIYYEYNNNHRQIADIVEDEFGYGQFTKDTSCYQNVNKKAKQTCVKELSFAENKLKLECKSESMYVNDDASLAAKDQGIDNNVHFKTYSDEEVDPFYDHAKAGGHEWDNKEMFNIVRIEKPSEIDEHIYMNDKGNNSQHKEATFNREVIESDTATCKVPLYLELEPEVEDNISFDSIESTDKGANEPITSETYDYASSNNVTNGVVEEKDTPTDDSASISENRNSSNNFQEGSDKTDSVSIHDYFILEKVER